MGEIGNPAAFCGKWNATFSTDRIPVDTPLGAVCRRTLPTVFGKGYWHTQLGPHFAVGRKRILSRPLWFYQDLLLASMGQVWHVGSERWNRNFGLQVTSGFWME